MRELAEEQRFILEVVCTYYTYAEQEAGKLSYWLWREKELSRRH